MLGSSYQPIENFRSANSRLIFAYLTKVEMDFSVYSMEMQHCLFDCLVRMIPKANNLQESIRYLLLIQLQTST